MLTLLSGSEMGRMNATTLGTSTTVVTSSPIEVYTVQPYGLA